MGLEGTLGDRVIEEPRRHEAVGLRAQCIGDPSERIALGARRPVAAGQRHDRRGDRCRAVLEGLGDRADRGPVADPHDLAVTDRAAQDLGTEPADHPARQVLRAGDRRGEVDGTESEALAERVGGRRLRGGPVDDPDLDDPLGAGTLEQAADLRAGDAQALGDGVLGLAQLVVQPAGADELLEVAHPPRPGARTDVLNRCAWVTPASSGAATAVSTGD